MADKRTVVKLIRFTLAESQAVTEHAHACGLPVARYVRDTALGAIPRIPRSNKNAEVIRQLGSLGNTMKQLASVANATGHLPQEAALHDVLHTILQALSTIE
jgi:hypothetical protein